MSAESFKRKLTAILSADVKGYSRLMGDNEAETVKTLTSYRKIMAELIQQHRGRVIDSPGDNILAEFASVVDAVQCSVAAQNEFKARNAELPENRRMEFRIGVNLGDVIEEENRIYGDGVNIAARLEALADPGGICISKTAFDQIETKLPLGYEYLGEQTVKNITKPVGAYRVVLEPRITVVGGANKKGLSRQRRVSLAIAVIVILLVGVLALWQFVLRPSPPSVEKADPKKMALPLPDRPSVAVLPFANMSDDKSQEYLADGITENIISALSQVPNLFVIARNSTFTYKGKPVKVQQVAEELGVRYVLEGSVQKSGDTLRITAQLIDAITGQHVWSERYDRELKKIFALQDDITMKVITALQVKLTVGDSARLMAKGTKNLEAYLKYLQALAVFNTQTKEGYAQARRLYEEVIALDPQYAAAYSALAGFHAMDAVQGFSKSPGESLNQALELTKKAIAIDESDAVSHSRLGWLYVLSGRDYDKAIAECERGIDLAPNSADCHIWMAYVLTMAGRSEEAVRYAEQALRLNPYAPSWWIRQLGQSYFFAGRYEEAIAAHKKSLNLSPKDLLTHIALTTAYSWAGRHEEARAQAAEILRITPKFSVEERAKFMPCKNQADLDRYLDGLRKAGLPDKPPLPLPDKPSIAVMPFVNMSEDKNQEFFSDGLTEEIITALSKSPALFVIGRHSSFVYKGKPVNVPQVSRELGVKYVLEGSVRRSGNQLRITAQLIDAMTGNHLWAERYDRELKDIFAIQDEVTIKIIASVTGRTVSSEERMRLIAKGASNLEAYLKCMEGIALQQGLNRDDNALAGKKFEEAIALDPQWAPAYAWLSIGYVFNFRFTQNPESIKKAYEYAKKAISLDETQFYAYYALAQAYLFRRGYEEAITAAEQAIKVAPGSADAYNIFGWALLAAGRPKESLVYLERALRMNPFPPTMYFMQIGTAHFFLRNYEEAVPALKKALSISPKNQLARFQLIITYVEMGRLEEARAEAKEFLMIDPKWKFQEWLKTAPFKDPDVAERWAEAIKKLGLEGEVRKN